VSAKNGLAPALVGVVLLLASLPLAWFTVRNAQVSSPNFSGMFGEGSGMPDMGSFLSSTTVSITANAFDGTVELFASLPIWFVVLAGVIAGILAALRSAVTAAIPAILIWLVWGFASVHVGMVLYVVTRSPDADLGAAPLVAGLALVLMLPALLARGVTAER